MVLESEHETSTVSLALSLHYNDPCNYCYYHNEWLQWVYWLHDYTYILQHVGIPISQPPRLIQPNPSRIIWLWKFHSQYIYIYIYIYYTFVFFRMSLTVESIVKSIHPKKMAYVTLYMGFTAHNLCGQRLRLPKRKQSCASWFKSLTRIGFVLCIKAHSTCIGSVVCICCWSKACGQAAIGTCTVPYILGLKCHHWRYKHIWHRIR